MKVIYSNDSTVSYTPCVATVGIFDGVHAGHRFLIEELKTLAREQQLESTVITFAEHPRKVLHNNFKPVLLDTLSEKLIQLESTGIDACIVLDFSAEMAKLSAYEFIKTILVEKFHVNTLLVGHDHRFGHNRTEGFAEYKKHGESLGITVTQATRYHTTTFLHISSSEVRTALQNGEINAANQLLTYPYSFSGKVIDGFRLGRKIGFPTANLAPDNQDKLIPGFGVYAVRVHWNKQIYKGMMNIGIRPTLENGLHTSLEVHILDFNEDIYNQTIRVEFITKIRNEQKFNGIDELINQLQKDKEVVLSMDF
jgi:riboflavin kinase/FMN adenylyltransferase